MTAGGLMLDPLHWVYNTTLATSVRQTQPLFAAIESVHVVAFTAVVGSIFSVDLRLMGLASRSRPISVMLEEVLPLTWIAFVFALLSGATLFCSNAPVYFQNSAFRLKMLLILLAGINMAVFHLATCRNVGTWDLMPRPPRAVRAAGALSVILWFASIAWGRWIGYSLN